MKNESFILDIESLSYGGRGIGKTKEGKVVFAPMSIPGEKVRVETHRDHSGFIEAKFIDVISPSPSRVNPACEVFSHCGGCTWQHIAYDDQLKWKNDILLREISKVCRVMPEKLNPPQPSQNIYEYRCHARIQCSDKPEFKLGFFQEASKNVVEFEKCPVLVLPIQKAIDDLASLLKKYPVPGLYEIDIRAPENEVILLLKCKGRMQKNTVGIARELFNKLPASGMAIESWHDNQRHIFGQTDCSYFIPAGDSRIKMISGFEGFIQANASINREMINYVANLAKESDHVLDLYCGNGNFSLPIDHLVKQITAIDNDEDLIRQAKMIAKEHGFENIKFHSADALSFLKDMGKNPLRFDTVIMDPPREGAKEIADSLGVLGSRVIYISCNPTTMLRDIKIMLSHGFRFKSIKLFDMFPHTYHIESVAYLER
jgi:23S rRNA (uracil1939-C5)-methyltransferase